MANTYDQQAIDAMTDEQFNEMLEGFSDVTPEGYGAGSAAEDETVEEAAAEAAENGVTPEEVESAEGAEGAQEPYRTFGTEDEYNSALDAYANDRYGERLSQADADHAQLDRLAQLADGYYGEGGVDALIADLEQLNAQRAGQEVDAYRRAQTDAADLARYRAAEKEQQEAQQRQQEAQQRIMESWQRQAEYLKRSVPDFDLDKAFENPQFAEMVTNGASIDGAYYAMNPLTASGGPLPLSGGVSGGASGRRTVPQNAQQKGARGGGGTLVDTINAAKSDREVLDAIRRYNASRS